MIHIAMVDDNNTVLMVNNAMLKRNALVSDGDVVDLFQTSTSFYEIIKVKGAEYYDIVVCDHDLRGEEIKGFDLLVKLQQNGYKGSCVLLTGEDKLIMKLKFKMGGKNITYILKDNNQGKDGALSKLGLVISSARNKG